MKVVELALFSVAAVVWLRTVSSQPSSIIISEIADKGTRNDNGICKNGGSEGQDWIELYNAGNGTVDLSAGSYVLHDNKGYLHENVYQFGEGSTVIEAGEYLVVCPAFGIGGADTVTLAILTGTPLVDTATARSSLYKPVSSVSLPNTDDAFDVTYAWDPVTQLYSYTSTPTPNAANFFTPPQEADERWKAELAARNDLGAEFFNMDRNGYPVDGALDDLLDFQVTMDDEDYQYMMQNASFEVYRPFRSASLHRLDGDNLTEPFWTMDYPSARIRPRGQSTLYLGICVGTNTIPFQLDFGSQSDGLFGVGKLVLRNHLGDNSYARDWSYNIMLARFGLPHLRARHVRFWVNGVGHGLYTLLEAVDQEYVFSRSFPAYNPNQYALYKVKTMSLGCGQYSEQGLELAQYRMETDIATPPYNFQRGEHRPSVKSKGPEAMNQCMSEFMGDVMQSFADATLAYLRYDESCPDMLLGEGLIDLDLGTDDFKKSMKEFIPTFMSGPIFSPGGEDTEVRRNVGDLVAHVDQENSLKMLAFYAVALIFDSPLGNGNNYFWAEGGSKTTPGWKIFAWDFNTPNSITCNPTICQQRLVDWTIARPTCASWDENPWVGPLLADADRYHQYLQYVQDFVEHTYGNETFVQQIQDHMQAIDAEVRKDFWSFGGMFRDVELSPDAGSWEDGEMQLPLLPTMKARADSVRQQLEAMEAKTFPRGPHGVGMDGVDYEPYETCPDWRSAQPERVASCYNDCHYVGCHMPGWTTESMCDPNSGSCFHGDYDEGCTGIPDMGRYEGMEDRNTSFWTFCTTIDEVPTKISMCPEPAGKESCPQDCLYDGCSTPDMESHCDTATRTCYHGNKDDKCAGVFDGFQYPDMEEGSVCFNVSSIPTKMSRCPTFLEGKEESLGTTSSNDASGAAVPISTLHLLTALIASAMLLVTQAM